MKILIRKSDSRIIKKFDSSDAVIISENFIEFPGGSFYTDSPENYDLIDIPDVEDIPNFIPEFYLYEKGIIRRSKEIDKAWYNIMAEKKSRLESSDWTQIQDNNLTVDEKKSWSDYRSLIREIKEEGNPFTLEWPRYPGEIRPDDLFDE